jgi:hypothetical protein
MDRRNELLLGIISFPEQIRNMVNPSQDININNLIDDFWNAITNNYLREKHTNTLVWLEKFNDNNLFNNLITHLCRADWITSSVDVDYAYIEFNENKLLKWINKEEIISIKYQYKFSKYRLTSTKSTLSDVVQLNGKRVKTGLIREGFMKAGNTKFKYDTKYINKYMEYIIINIQKGLKGSTKDITYQEITSELINWYSVDGTEYTLGNCLIDSRGRSIFQCSKKVFNPVSCKDARALLVLPSESISEEGFEAIYASIAELNGYRGKDWNDKISKGNEMYKNRELPNIEDMIISKNYDDLHKLIWLERIYENLDNYNGSNWVVPVEYDALASLMQLIGVLTNDYNYMVKTNMIETKKGFQDIWTVPYASRTHIKKALTPMLYGSGKDPKELWEKNKLEYTQEQLNKVGEELEIGLFSNARKFKDFIINNVSPKATMKVNIRGEEFTIKCNRFKWEKTTQVHNWVYTSQQGVMKKVTRNVSLIPDLEQFKRYFQTCLCHNLDSQIANKICLEIDGVLPNHDSFTLSANKVNKVRELYTKEMYSIWTNRKEILSNYFKSIGITESFKEQSSGNIIHTKGVKSFSKYCLK